MAAAHFYLLATFASLGLNALLVSAIHADDIAPPANTAWQRPTLVPIPTAVTALPLNFSNTAPRRATVTIPADWADKHIVFRSEGAGNGAKLFVNDQFIRDHYGPNLPFTADITDKIKPGTENALTLDVDQRRDGLARFFRGGGFNPAQLMALPANYLGRVHADTTFDKSYKDATLHVWLTVNFSKADTAKVKITLADPAGKVIPLGTVELTPKSADRIFDFPVPNAIKWDAEHPNLYTMDTSLLAADGSALETVSKKIGLRQIEVKGNQMFVNGQEIKLRGVWGGSVQQIKDFNGNHTRQKWAGENFFNDADRLGLYVLDENPVDFAKYGPESDPQWAYQWMGFITNMIEYDRDHPSIIMWGLGNESWTGPNILKMFKYAQLEDVQRPCIFSFGNRVPPDQELPYSIFSSHYPDMADPATNLADFTVAKWQAPSLLQRRKPLPIMPVLNDEYGHVVQNQALRTRDPNVRSFWGESLSRYWEKMFTSKGSLGGDIFGLTGGFGATSNELSLVAKAYSPVRIANEPLPNPGPGKPLPVPIKNWFDHTNLNELAIAWSVGTETGTLTGADISPIAPHSEGKLLIPARTWKDNDQLALKFSRNGAPVDEFLLAINPPQPELPKPQGPAPKIETAGTKIIVSGEHFKVTFDKFRGLMENAAYDGKTVLTDGPFLNLLGSGLSFKEWWIDDFKTKIDGNQAVINIRGNFAIINVSYEIRIDGTGLITTQYTINHLPGDPPPPTFSPWDATSVGGYSEVGISYMMPSAPTISWKRKGYFSVYPANNVGRDEGSAQSNDDFIATKENIYWVTADADTGGTATALSDGRDAVRFYQDRPTSMPAGVRMCINNEWNYPDIGIGNWCKPPLLIRSGYTATVYLKLGAK